MTGNWQFSLLSFKGCLLVAVKICSRKVDNQEPCLLFTYFNAEQVKLSWNRKTAWSFIN